MANQMSNAIKNATLEAIAAQKLYEAKLNEFEVFCYRPTASRSEEARKNVHDALDAVLDTTMLQIQNMIKEM